MAYEDTPVPVSKSQEQIKKLVVAHKGSRIAFISEPPREGFQAELMIDSVPYMVRVSATIKNRNPGRTAKQIADWREREEKRIWRVLFYHLKSVFEAADSGVMEFRELMLPYIVTKSGATVAEQLLPRLAEAIDSNPSRLLI